MRIESSGRVMNTLRLLCLASLLVACGAPSTSTETANEPRRGDPIAEPSPTPEFGDESAPPVQRMAATLVDPNLTVEATAPRPVDLADAGEPIAPGPTAFEGVIHVRNTGDSTAEIKPLNMDVELVDAEGEMTPCATREDGHETVHLSPRTAETYRIHATCPLSRGTYEVRLYASFDADELAGDLERERYYVGRREITVD